MKKLTMWFPNRSDTKRAVEAQKMAADWKFWSYKVKELYYPKSKALIRLAVTAKLSAPLFSHMQILVFS